MQFAIAQAEVHVKKTHKSRMETSFEKHSENPHLGGGAS
jgi:hypothetical protein